MRFFGDLDSPMHLADLIWSSLHCKINGISSSLSVKIQLSAAYPSMQRVSGKPGPTFPCFRTVAIFNNVSKFMNRSDVSQGSESARKTAPNTWIRSLSNFLYYFYLTDILLIDWFEFYRNHGDIRGHPIGTPAPSLCGHHLYFSHCNYDTSVTKFPGVEWPILFSLLYGFHSIFGSVFTSVLGMSGHTGQSFLSSRFCRDWRWEHWICTLRTVNVNYSWFEGV
jgi:hypothetical protein